MLWKVLVKITKHHSVWPISCPMATGLHSTLLFSHRFPDGIKTAGYFWVGSCFEELSPPPSGKAVLKDWPQPMATKMLTLVCSGLSVPQNILDRYQPHPCFWGSKMRLSCPIFRNRCIQRGQIQCQRLKIDKCFSCFKTLMDIASFGLDYGIIKKKTRGPIKLQLKSMGVLPFISNRTVSDQSSSKVINIMVDLLKSTCPPLLNIAHHWCSLG